MNSDGGCKNAAAAVNFRLKSLAEFFAAHGEKSIKYIFAEGVYLGKNTSRSESVEQSEAQVWAQNFFPKNLWFLGKQNKTERSPAPFRYMVEDKMKKMKNCYLQLLIYPKDVSY